MKNFYFLLLVVTFSCNTQPKELPIIGFQETLDDGTIKYHTIPPFSFVNQDSLKIENDSFKNKIYAADFFFTSCPSICPKVMKQMVRIADSQENNEKFRLVSHTIDPKRDTHEVLKIYADNLGIDQSKWHFLTGQKDELLDSASF